MQLFARSVGPFRHPPTSARAYTLIEMLVALVIFALITSATGLAISVGLRGRQAIQQKTDQAAEVRSLVDIFTRDLQSAYAVTRNPITMFLASGSGSGDLLTFSTLAHRINLPSGDQTPRAQSDLAVVRYSLDPESGALTRSETSVPNPDSLIPAGAPSTVVSRHVRSVTFDMLNANGDTVQSWNYLNDPNATGQGGAASGGAASGAAAAATTTGDTSLPQAVTVRIGLERPGEPPIQLETTIAISMPTPQPAGQMPPAATTTAATGGGGPKPGGGGNQGGGGGPKPGGGGGPGGGSLPPLPGGAPRPGG